jgi:hypothetical protein
VQLSSQIHTSDRQADEHAGALLGDNRELGDDRETAGGDRALERLKRCCFERGRAVALI